METNRIETEGLLTEQSNQQTEQPKPYIFHNDPGHPWLEVKISELKQLGIADKISSYSYMKGNTGFMFVSMQMRSQRLDGLPYLDAKTFHGWIENGFKVRKGEKSTLDGITWINCEGNKVGSEDDKPGYMIPKVYHLFHRSQVVAA